MITTSRYDVAEHLRTPEEMEMYLDACIEVSDSDAAFIAKALADIARAQSKTETPPITTHHKKHAIHVKFPKDNSPS